MTERWVPNPPKIGSWVEFADGYRYRVTEGGPCVKGQCVDCGNVVYVVQRTGRIGHGGLEEDTGGSAKARCSTCGRRHYGLPPS